MTVSPLLRFPVLCVFTLFMTFLAPVVRAQAQAVRVITGDVDTRQVQALSLIHI